MDINRGQFTDSTYTTRGRIFSRGQFFRTEVGCPETKTDPQPLHSLKTEVGSYIPSSVITVDVTWTSTEDSLPTVHTLPENGFFAEVGFSEPR